MIPRIFPPGDDRWKTAFVGWSPTAGVLSDCISCNVTEELNGEYYLEMTYPLDGVRAESIVEDAMIIATPNDADPEQAFRIQSVAVGINRCLNVYATHNTYDNMNCVVAPFTLSRRMDLFLRTLATNALGGTLNGHIPAEELMTDFPSTYVVSYSQDVPKTLRKCFYGSEGSLKQLTGGDMRYLNDSIWFIQHRGNDNGVVISYGKNLTDYEQERNIATMLSDIYPYYKTEDTYVELPEKILSTTEWNLTRRKIKAVDLTEYFEDDVPTPDKLREAAQSYIEANALTHPKISIKVSFVPLWQTEEYKNIEPLEHVSLGDDVTIWFPAFEQYAKARVNKTVYNTLTDKYKSVSIGDAKATLDQTIANLIER